MSRRGELGGARPRFVFVLAAVLLAGGGVVGTAAVGVGPAADLLGDGTEPGTTQIGNGTVFIQPADSPEGDAYASLDDGDIAVDIDGLSPLSTTQVDDLVRVGFDSPEPPVNGTALIALNATGPLDNDSAVDVTFVDMRTGEPIAETADELDASGLALDPGDRANVGVVIDGATGTQISTEVRIIVDEPGVADFQVELDLDAPGQRTRANETIVGQTLTSTTSVTNVGSREDTKPVVLRVDGRQVDRATLFVEPGQNVTTELAYQTRPEDVPDGTAEDPIAVEVESDNSTDSADVLVLAEIHRYTNPETRVVTTFGLFDAIEDFRNDEIPTLFLFDVIDAWRSEQPVPPSGDIPGG